MIDVGLPELYSARRQALLRVQPDRMGDGATFTVQDLSNTAEFLWPLAEKVTDGRLREAARERTMHCDASGRLAFCALAVYKPTPRAICAGKHMGALGLHG